jgi:hypothetical protein
VYEKSNTKFKRNKGGVSGTSVPDTPMGLAGKDSHADAQVKQE